MESESISGESLSEVDNCVAICDSISSSELDATILKHFMITKNQAKDAMLARRNVLHNEIAKSKEQIKENVQVYQNKWNPFSVFPAELWVLIFKQVGDENDLMTISRTSIPLDNLLHKSEYLFKNAFPLLNNFLPKSDILNCRVVCTRWRSGVDAHLENYFTVIPSSSNRPIKIYQFYYNFYLHPNVVPLSVQNYIHTQNPLIGRMVVINDMLWYANGGYGDHLHSFLLALNSLLYNLGSHIWYMTINISSELNYYSLVNLMFACLAILHECPNLKGLYIWANNFNFRQGKRPLGMCLPNHASLQELVFSLEGMNITSVQEDFVQKYSNQLKRLLVQIWNPTIFHTYSWSCLTQLHISVSTTMPDNILQSLLQTKAVNLQVLGLKMEGLPSQHSFLEYLHRLCDHFSNLCKLKLDICGNSEAFQDKDIATLAPDFSCCTGVTTLELVLNNLEISFDFLICFPMLQRLVIVYANFVIPSEPNDIETLSLVKLSGYLILEFKNIKTIYKSNVWEVLPCLKTVVLVKFRDFVIYTREGYEHAKIQATKNGPE